MKPQEALNLLEQATGLLQLSRQDHANITLALNVLRVEISPAQQTPKKPA